MRACVCGIRTRRISKPISAIFALLEPQKWILVGEGTLTAAPVGHTEAEGLPGQQAAGSEEGTPQRTSPYADILASPAAVAGLGGEPGLAGGDSDGDGDGDGEGGLATLLASPGAGAGHRTQSPALFRTIGPLPRPSPHPLPCEHAAVFAALRALRTRTPTAHYSARLFEPSGHANEPIILNSNAGVFVARWCVPKHAAVLVGTGRPLP